MKYKKFRYLWIFLIFMFAIKAQASFKTAIIPSDSYFSNQWHLKKIKAIEAWDIKRESPDIIIAVIDSGVQINHPDLKDNIWINTKEIPGNNFDDDSNGYIDDVNGWDFVNNEADPSPNFDEGYTVDGIIHGTVVAGVIAASGNNAAGVTGVTWRAQIMPLRVLDQKGEGDTRQVVKAINYAIDNHANIINFSFVGFGMSYSLNKAIQKAHEAGIVMIAAAGNEKEGGQGNDLDKNKMYPVCHDGNKKDNWVLGVTATDALDQKAGFASFGFDCVDISAPGVSIYSTTVHDTDKLLEDKSFGKYYDGYWSGTSMAAPIVSGAAALVMQVNPSLTKSEIVDVLLSTADNINRLNPEHFGKVGAGRINIQKAVLKAKEMLKNYKYELLVSPFSGRESVVSIKEAKGRDVKKFNAYSQNFQGGVKISTGDINGDGEDEIVTGTGVGGGPHIKIFNKSGKVLNQFFAYDKNYRNGVNVAVGDINGDGQAEIITGSGPGHLPEVKIFNFDGSVFHKFLAYGSNFKGGVYVATGDIDGDKIDEIVTGTGNGGGPQVRIFESNGRAVGQFFAYNENFRGGVHLTVGNIDGGKNNNKAEIITGAGVGGGPHVRIFDNHGNLINQFFAYNKKFRGGVTVATGDINNDGIKEIITGAGPTGAPHVRSFKTDGTLLTSFYAYEEEFTGGVYVSSLKTLDK